VLNYLLFVWSLHVLCLYTIYLLKVEFKFLLKWTLSLLNIHSIHLDHHAIHHHPTHITKDQKLQKKKAGSKINFVVYIKTN